jgi:hypothetical protein
MKLYVLWIKGAYAPGYHFFKSKDGSDVLKEFNREYDYEYVEDEVEVREVTMELLLKILPARFTF